MGSKYRKQFLSIDWDKVCIVLFVIALIYNITANLKEPSHEIQLEELLAEETPSLEEINTLLEDWLKEIKPEDLADIRAYLASAEAVKFSTEQNVVATYVYSSLVYSVTTEPTYKKDVALSQMILREQVPAYIVAAEGFGLGTLQLLLTAWMETFDAKEEQLVLGLLPTVYTKEQVQTVLSQLNASTSLQDTVMGEFE